MIFPNLFADQLRETESNPFATRSNKILFPLHSAIADIVAQHTEYQVMSLPGKEYSFISDIGTKMSISLLLMKRTT